MPGGDLRYHFAKHRKFTEEQTSKIKYYKSYSYIRVLHGMHAALPRVFAWQKHFA